MSDLRPCPRCSRHVDASERACPFCDAELAGALPGKLRLVSRRELTRAAIFAGAALLAGACGVSSTPSDELDEHDEHDDSAGGETEETTDLSHASDDGSGARGSGDEESEAEAEARRRREAEAGLQQLREAEEQRRRWEDERRERNRRLCTPEGVCPPYGAPPVPDALV